ncbi:MAG: hypothetical protein ACI840_001165 [Ulvibacter sp.]|jgi:hypothetical protein
MVLQIYRGLTRPVFFDMDNDGDLDMYLINNPKEHTKAREYKTGEIRLVDLNPTYAGSDKLYQNNNGNFIDITKKAGLVNADYGLGIVAADLNNDGYQDLYIANDYSKPDAILINNKNGTFKNTTASTLKHMSKFSMGVDIADINNDGLLDIFNSEMLGQDNYSKKVNMASMNPKLYWGFVNSGYHYQDMHNSLQLNNGNDTFSEIAWMANVAETDWSWCPLIAGFDNNGTNDIALGYYNNNSLYPVRGLQCSAEQNPDLKESIRSFSEFGSLTFDAVYNKYDLSDAIKLEATYFQSAVFINNKTSFSILPLPNENQMAPTNRSIALDIRGKITILTIGNFHPVEVETGRYDAHTGTVLVAQGEDIVYQSNTGFFNDKDARDIDLITINGKKHIVVANNREQLTFFEVLE